MTRWDPDSPEGIVAWRLQFLGAGMLVCAAVTMFVWYWPFTRIVDANGTLVGADFPVFWLPARYVLERDSAHLYDLDAHTARLHETFPECPRDSRLPALYPPFVPTLLAPLGLLPYLPAFWLFLTINALLIWWSWRRLKTTTAVLATPWVVPAGWAYAGHPAVLESLAGGQASPWAVAIYAGAAAALSTSRPILAGALLGLGAYKPNVLGLVALGVFVRFPRAVVGAAAVGVALLAVGWLGTGREGWENWVGLFLDPNATTAVVLPPLEKFHNLARIWPAAVDRRLLLAQAACGVVLAVLVGVSWRRRPTDDPVATPRHLAALVVVNTLFNPYLPMYDLALLAPAGVLAADALTRVHGPSIGRHVLLAQALLALLLFGPHLSQITAVLVGSQWFAPVLGIAFVWFWSATRPDQGPALPRDPRPTAPAEGEPV